MTDSTEEVSLTRSEMLEAARERLRVVLEMLGTHPEEILLDQTVTGAAVLAIDAAELLGALARDRDRENDGGSES